MIKFNHFNFNVLDLERSIAFYKEALGLEIVREKKKEDFTLVYLGEKYPNIIVGDFTYIADTEDKIILTCVDKKDPSSCVTAYALSRVDMRPSSVTAPRFRDVPASRQNADF